MYVDVELQEANTSLQLQAYDHPAQLPLQPSESIFRLYYDREFDEVLLQVVK